MSDTQSSREWVRLTVEEIDKITDREYGLTQFSPIYEAHRGFAYAIEAKIKDKNT